MIYSFDEVAGYISIHALREEGDKDGYVRAYSKAISIHALREEGDNPTGASGF